MTTESTKTPKENKQFKRALVFISDEEMVAAGDLTREAEVIVVNGLVVKNRGGRLSVDTPATPNDQVISKFEEWTTTLDEAFNVVDVLNGIQKCNLVDISDLVTRAQRQVRVIAQSMIKD